MNKKYGHRENVCVLYRGTPFHATSGTYYLNISDFLQEIYKTPDVEKVMFNLTKNLPVKELQTDESHKFTEKKSSFEDAAHYGKIMAEAKRSSQQKNTNKKEKSDIMH